MYFGIIHEPLSMLQSDFAVYIGIVYSYLPFMILPLYANLEKHDNTLLEAAADLGATPMTGFFRITLPQSIAGIIAGSLLVFIPAVGEYVVPSLLGRTDQLMIGRVLSDEFFENRDWPVASAVAILILLALVIPIMLFPTFPAARAGGAGMTSRGFFFAYGAGVRARFSVRAHPVDDRVFVQQLQAGDGLGCRPFAYAQVVRRVVVERADRGRRLAVDPDRAGLREPARSFWERSRAWHWHGSALFEGGPCCLE